MVDAGSLIREARRRAGLTQAQLAQRLGRSQAEVARLERPGASLTTSTLDRTLHATGHRLRLSAEAFEPSVDESLLASRLKMTPGQRLADMQRRQADARAVAHAGARARGERS